MLFAKFHTNGSTPFVVGDSVRLQGTHIDSFRPFAQDCLDFSCSVINNQYIIVRIGKGSIPVVFRY